MTIRPALSLILVVVSLALAIQARGSEGVREINQACVVTGCFSGDGAGFPVTITAEGSYRLTSSLVASLARDAIRIEATDVTLDLNGFSIGGSNVGTIGIWDFGVAGVERAVIRNGSIHNFTSHGISLQGGLNRIEQVQLISNAGSGVLTGQGSWVVENLIMSNGSHGVELVGSLQDQAQGLVSGNIITDNDGDGINTLRGTRVSGNILLANDDAIDGSNTLVEHNVILQNFGDAIELPTPGRALVAENVLYLNSGFGALELATIPTTGYARNAINSNVMGTISVTGTPQQLDANVCNGDLTCP